MSMQKMIIMIALLFNLPSLEKCRSSGIFTKFNRLPNLVLSLPTRENELVLVIVNIESKRILRLSFNGSEGSNGTLKIYDVSHKLVKESDLEIIRTPYYASLDITDIPAGTYRAELTTKISVHTSDLIIK